MSGERILIVDDERDLLETLAYNLGREGLRTVCVTTGAEALRVARETPPPDLVLLDLMLPDIAGIDVCRKLRADRATQRIPIVMLTAKTEEIDRVVGFELGADDYIGKPFSVREVVLRIKAVLRRVGAREGVRGDGESELVFGALRLDVAGHQVWVDGKTVALTALEFKLLHTLVARRGRVQTREQLLEDVWDIRADVTTRTVDTHVKRLRHKLGPAADCVETLRGVGYRFRVPTDDVE